MKQQARGGVGVIRVFFNQRAGRQYGSFVDLVHGHAVVQVTHGFRDDRVCLDVGPQTSAGVLNARLQFVQIQCDAFARFQYMNYRGSWFGQFNLFCPFLRAPLAIQDIGTRNFVVTAAHQTELYLVLHIFNMECATGRA